MVIDQLKSANCIQFASKESCSLKVEHKIHGKLHVRHNTDDRPIENKYCEGNVKRTLKKELTVFEIAGREVIRFARRLLDSFDIPDGDHSP